jgi:hypothetical protein
MNVSHALILSIALSTVFLNGCRTNEHGSHIVMAEGSLSVNNQSNVDIFPVVMTKRKEDFGGVSVGAFKVVGFASIDVQNIAKVTWAEPKWNSPQKTVVFDLAISPEVARDTKHLEFYYSGNGGWVLNLYGASHPHSEDLLKSITGR